MMSMLCYAMLCYPILSYNTLYTWLISSLGSSLIGFDYNSMLQYKQYIQHIYNVYIHIYIYILHMYIYIYIYTHVSIVYDTMHSFGQRPGKRRQSITNKQHISNMCVYIYIMFIVLCFCCFICLLHMYIYIYMLFVERT